MSALDSRVTMNELVALVGRVERGDLKARLELLDHLRDLLGIRSRTASRAPSPLAQTSRGDA